MKRFSKTVILLALLALAGVWAPWTGSAEAAPSTPARPLTREQLLQRRRELQNEYVRLRGQLNSATGQDVRQLLGQAIAIEKQIVGTAVGNTDQEREQDRIRLYQNPFYDNPTLAGRITFKDGNNAEVTAATNPNVAALWNGFETTCNNRPPGSGATAPVSDNTGPFPTLLRQVQRTASGSATHSGTGGTTGGELSQTQACSLVSTEAESALVARTSAPPTGTPPGTPPGGTPPGQGQPQPPNLDELRDLLAKNGQQDPAIADLLRRLQQQQADDARRRAAEDAARQAALGQGAGSGGGGAPTGGEGSGTGSGGGGEGSGSGSGGKPQHSGNKLKDIASRMGRNRDNDRGNGGNSRGATSSRDSDRDKDKEKEQKQPDFSGLGDDFDEKPKPNSAEEEKPPQSASSGNEPPPQEDFSQQLPAEPPAQTQLAGAALPVSSGGASPFPPPPALSSSSGVNSALNGQQQPSGSSQALDGGAFFQTNLGDVPGEMEMARGMDGYTPPNVNAGTGAGPALASSSNPDDDEEPDELEGSVPSTYNAGAGVVGGKDVNLALARAAFPEKDDRACANDPDFPGIFGAMHCNIEEHGEFCERPNLNLGLCQNENVRRIFMPGRLRSRDRNT